MNEFELIERFFARAPRSPSVHLGVGDDAALMGARPGWELAVTVDMLVAGRHFLPDTDPEGLGHKTLAVNLSDLAAMGAVPRWALLACALPAADPAWLEAFARGFLRLAETHGVDLVGGDTTRGPLNLCVTLIGEVPAGTALLRSGARPGDDIYVSGRVGEAAFALAADVGELAPGAAFLAHCRVRLDRPEPRVALGSALRGVASAALDVSDGLVGDLGHILERSGVGAVIDLATLPRAGEVDTWLAGAARAPALRCLLAGGDDYELCFTAPPAARARIAAMASEQSIALTRIGHIVEGRSLVVHDESGVPLASLPGAFDHFRSVP